MFATARLGGIALPISAAGAPEPTDGGVLLPPGPVAALHPWADTAFYRHGWNSWSPSGWRPLAGPPLRIADAPDRLLTADDAANDTPLAHSGSAVGALEDGGGGVLLLGALGLGTPRVGADRHTLWGTTESAGGGWFLAHGPEEQVFAAYARQVAQRLGHRAADPGAVWSSWYSFYEDIDEALIGRTVDGLAGLPFDVVQLDDGWERRVGDWVANERFPSGLHATADRIGAAGFRPGLWLAPLIALPDSRFAIERPDLLVQRDGRPMVAGHNWGTGYFALDTTQPEVRDHLARVLRGVVDDGFRYLKLDFLYAGALPSERARDVPREQAYREALAHLRAVVGDDVFLLGCGAPILPSVGLLDGMRVGPDTAAFWDNAERSGDPSGSGLRNALAASVERAWQAPWFRLDPDVVPFRRRRSLLDEPQRQAAQDLATAFGFKSTSDPADWLTNAERAELAAWLRAAERVERLGRHRWRIDGREVDLGPLVAPGAAAHPSTAVE